MFNFFRRKNKNTPKSKSTENSPKKASSTPPIPSSIKPAWLDYMSDSEYIIFISHVNEYFEDLGLKYHIDDGVIKVEENDLGLNNLGISNVSQACAQNNPKDYKRIVYEHFDQMQKIYVFNRKFEKIDKEWELVKEYIGIRLITSESIGVIGAEHLLAEAITRDTSTMLIYDTPYSTSNIKPNMLDKWGKTLEEVYEMAYANCKNNYPFIPNEHNIDGVKIQVFSAEHFFSPMVIKYPEVMAKYTSDYGALVIFPTRHLCMVYKIEDLGVVHAVNKLIGIAHGSFRDGPGSLSPLLYWYLPDHSLTELPYKLTDKLEFTPPKKFVDMMNLLEPQEQQNSYTGLKILPRIKANYGHEIYKNDSGPFLGNKAPNDLEIPEKFLPIVTDVTADLSMMFAIDKGNTYEVLQNEFLEDNPSYTIERLKEEAIQNVFHEIQDQIQLKGNVQDKCMLTCGGNFEASLLFLDLWGQIHDGMGEEIYIALPTRDVLLIARINEENKRVLLDAIKGYFDSNADFLTSKALYKRRRGSMELEIVDIAF